MSEPALYICFLLCFIIGVSSGFLTKSIAIGTMLTSTTLWLTIIVNEFCFAIKGRKK
jgi:hypothetical protein